MLRYNAHLRPRSGHRLHCNCGTAYLRRRRYRLCRTLDKGRCPKHYSGCANYQATSPHMCNANRQCSPERLNGENTLPAGKRTVTPPNMAASSSGARTCMHSKVRRGYHFPLRTANATVTAIAGPPHARRCYAAVRLLRRFRPVVGWSTPWRRSSSTSQWSAQQGRPTGRRLRKGGPRVWHMDDGREVV